MVRKIAVEKQQAHYQPQVIIGKRRVDRLLVGDQWNFTGGEPEWSDCEEPVQKVNGATPVINTLVLGLPFFHRYFSLPPYWYTTLFMGEGVLRFAGREFCLL